MMIFTIVKKETLKHIARFTLACMCFNALNLKAEDYTQKIYDYLVKSGEFLQDYTSIYDFFNRWYINSTYENSFQIFNSPTALYDIYNPEGMQEETKMMTYQQYLDFIATSAHEGWRIEPSMWAIHQHLYASNMYTAAENLAKGNLGGGNVTVTNNFTFTLDDFLGVVPVAGDYSYMWSEWLMNLIHPDEYITPETRWQSYRQLKASRELQENLNMLTGDGIIGVWNGYGVENWIDRESGIGYDVQQLLKNVKSGDGSDLIPRILEDWGLSPTEKANLINHSVQGGQRNLISDIKDNLQKIVEDGVKVSNTNEFPWSGEGGGGGIALPSDFFSAFSNLNDNVSNINTQQNERVDKYAVYWRGNLSVLEGLMETTKSGVDEEFSNHINSISNKFFTSKNLLSSLWLNPNFSSFESQLNQMLRVLAVYECPEKVLIYKLDGISNWLYSFGLISIAESIRDKDISIDMNTEFEVFNGSISWKKIVDTMRIFFIVFYCLWGWYVFCRFIIFLTTSFIYLLHFVQKSFASIVKIFK